MVATPLPPNINTQQNNVLWIGRLQAGASSHIINLIVFRSSVDVPLAAAHVGVACYDRGSLAPVLHQLNLILLAQELAQVSRRESIFLVFLRTRVETIIIMKTSMEKPKAFPTSMVASGGRVFMTYSQHRMCLRMWGTCKCDPTIYDNGEKMLNCSQNLDISRRDRPIYSLEQNWLTHAWLQAMTLNTQ